MKTHKTKIALWVAVVTTFIAPFSARSAGYHKSGVIGQSLGVFCFQCPAGGPYTPCPPGALPLPAPIFVYSEDYKLVGQVETDEHGAFEIFLKPGNYWLLPSPHAPYIALSSSPVVVRKKEFTSLVFYYQLGAQVELQK